MTCTREQLFDFEGCELRVVVVDGHPWWVAADVARVLEIGRTHDAVRRLDPYETRTDTIRTSAGPRQATFINESGLYALILTSRKPEAERFKRWVTSEVLPSLRQTGSYTLGVPKTYAEALRAAADMADAKVRAEAERDFAQSQVLVLTPKAESWSTLAEAVGDYSVADAAKILSRDASIGIGQNRLFAKMVELEMIRRTFDGRRRSYAPYQDHVDAGRLVVRACSYAHTKTGERVATSQLRVTVKGLEYLRKKLYEVSSMGVK